MSEARVLWIGPGHRIPTCVGVPMKWLKAYRHRVVTEWRGVILAVYRPKRTSSHTSTDHEPGCQSGDFGPCDCSLSSPDRGTAND